MRRSLQAEMLEALRTARSVLSVAAEDAWSENREDMFTSAYDKVDAVIAKAMKKAPPSRPSEGEG